MRKRFTGFALLIAMSGIGVAQESPSVQTAVSAPAPVPRYVRFAGQIKGKSGEIGITFTLHKQQQDESALWIETQNVKLDAEGKYSVLLGSTKSTGMPAELFASGEAQWLGIRADGQPEQRVLLVSVPYAMKAAEAETLAGHSASEFITSDKLTTVVQQQIEKQSGTAPAAKNSVGAKGNVVANFATNFIDSTPNQVVLVTQNGTGSGLIATAVSNYAIQAKSTTGTAMLATSGGNAALNATNTATTGTAYGVYGSTLSTSGVGFRGTASATSGSTSGVMGDSASTAGLGVYGTSSATVGSIGTGVYGRSAGDSGIGVKAAAVSATGATTGILSTVISPSGTALVLRNTANGKLLSGQTGASNTEVFSVDGSGNASARQFVSTVPFGTAPITVASSTQVTNLNASYLQGYAPSDFALLSQGVTQQFYEGIQTNGTNSNSPGGIFQGGTGQPGLEAYSGAASGANGGTGGVLTGGSATGHGGLGIQALGGPGGTTGGDGGTFTGGSGLGGGRGIGASGGNGTSSPGGIGGEFSGGSASGAAAGDGVHGSGGGASGSYAAGIGIVGYGGDGSSSAIAGLGLLADGGSNAATGGYGGTGARIYGGYAGAGTSGVGANIVGGNTSTGIAGDGLWVSPGAGGFGTPYAARFYGQIAVNSPVSGNSLQMQVGDPGCGPGFLGFGFGTNPFTMTGCQNYNVISNGTDLLLNVPTGGAIHFRQNNGDNLAISSSGFVSVSNTLFVGGNLNVSGSITAGTKDFVIDDPLDPKNKLLYHTSIESPDMKDLYDGVVMLNAKGEAWVTLPDYFEALNQDFRYTLTAIGRGAPYLHVAREIDGNRFKIAGGHANQKISWQVTGIRHDAFAKVHPAETEVNKTEAQRGKYLHPEAFGEPKEDAMDLNPRAAEDTTTVAQTSSVNVGRKR